MEWIGVEDRMPETKPECDFHSSDEMLVLIEGEVEIAKYQYGDEDGGWASWYSRCYEDTVERVTHWMPLPEPPKCE